jgi:type II secretion system protein C
MMQRMPWLVDAVVVLAAGLYMGILFQDSRQPERTVSAPVGVPSSASQVDIAALASVPLFGVEAEKSEPEAVTVQATTLKLKLAGSVSGGERPMAIIERPGKGQALYYVGDTLQAGVTLQAIHDREVIVRHGGKLERIAIEEPEMPQSAPVTIPAGRGHPTLHPMSARVAPAKASAEMLRLMPHFSGGKADGLMIGQLSSDSRYAKAGLRSGDIIRKVNGKAITSPQQAAQLRTALGDGQAEVEIVRNGQVQIIRTGKP